MTNPNLLYYLRLYTKNIQLHDCYTIKLFDYYTIYCVLFNITNYNKIQYFIKFLFSLITVIFIISIA